MRSEHGFYTRQTKSPLSLGTCACREGMGTSWGGVRGSEPFSLLEKLGGRASGPSPGPERAGTLQWGWGG